MRITPVGDSTWDDFADQVLPFIGLPELPHQMQQICPLLDADRIRHWVAMFNNENLDPDSRFTQDPGCWTDEEMDGLWYHRMKSIALECLNEIAGLRIT